MAFVAGEYLWCRAIVTASIGEYIYLPFIISFTPFSGLL
jgi:hypothetical protein